MKTLTSNTLRLEAFLFYNQTVLQQPHKGKNETPTMDTSRVVSLAIVTMQKTFISFRLPNISQYLSLSTDL